MRISQKNREIDADIFSWSIRDKIGLTLKQTNDLEDFLFSYIIHEKKEQKINTNFLIRLSAPLFLFIWLFTFFVIMPIHYLIIGKFYLDSDSKYVQFVKNWGIKIGFNI